MLSNTKLLIKKTKDGENAQSVEVVEAFFVKRNLVDNQYQQKSKVLYTLTLNKSYAYLLNLEPSNLVFWKLTILSLMKLSQHLLNH